MHKNMQLAPAGFRNGDPGRKTISDHRIGVLVHESGYDGE